MVTSTPDRGTPNGGMVFARIPLRRRLADAVFKWLCLAAILISVAVLITLLSRVWLDGSGRLTWDFLTRFASFRPENAGIKAAFVGSLAVMVLTAIISVPIGIAAAVYLEEFNRRKNWLSEFIKLNIANLAGVPSIVYGLLGLTLFVRWLALGQSIIAGALTMSLLILPMLITVTQEALKAVPNSFREGSLALGATQWQTISRQVLPAAAPGIFTGIILSLSRAVGETAPLLIVGAAAYVRFLPQKLSDNFTVLPIQIYNGASMPQKEFHNAAAGAIIALLILLLLLNGTAIFLRARMSSRSY